MKYIALIISIFIVSFAQASDVNEDPKARRAKKELQAESERETYRMLAERMQKRQDFSLLAEGKKVAPELMPITILNALDANPDWTFAGLDHFLQLTNLNLCKIDLKALPAAMTRLKHLEELNLSDNPLSILPDWIGDFTKLTILLVSDTRLGKKMTLSRAAQCGFPLTASKLTNLVWLDLSSNSLSAVPDAVLSMTNLETLELSRNVLRSLPPSLGKFPLKALYLGDNLLRRLPDDFSQLTKLQTLWLPNNLFRHLPGFLLNLTSLVSLHLERNDNLLCDPIYLGLKDREVVNLPMTSKLVNPVTKQEIVEPARIETGYDDPLSDESEVPSFDLYKWHSSGQYMDVSCTEDEKIMVLKMTLCMFATTPAERLKLAFAAAEMPEKPSEQMVEHVLKLLKLDDITIKAMMHQLNDRQ